MDCRWSRIHRYLLHPVAVVYVEFVVKRKIISLHSDQTQIRCGSTRRSEAITSAHRVTLSPHEHEWTRDEQEAMAEYCLWAYQRLSAVRQCVSDDPLEH